jgi:hypothetical protein
MVTTKAEVQGWGKWIGRRENPDPFLDVNQVPGRKGKQMATRKLAVPDL